MTSTMVDLLWLSQKFDSFQRNFLPILQSHSACSRKSTSTKLGQLDRKQQQHMFALQFGRLAPIAVQNVARVNGESTKRKQQTAQPWPNPLDMCPVEQIRYQSRPVYATGLSCKSRRRFRSKHVFQQQSDATDFLRKLAPSWRYQQL